MHEFYFILSDIMPEYFSCFFRCQSPFSQHHLCHIVIDGVAYNCSEQYMMKEKALFFGDVDTAMEIMATSNPKLQKKLGRQVRGFSQEAWLNVAEQVVWKANVAKVGELTFYYSLLNSGHKPFTLI